VDVSSKITSALSPQTFYILLLKSITFACNVVSNKHKLGALSMQLGTYLFVDEHIRKTNKINSVKQ